MNRKWMVVGALAAILALAGGVFLGRKVIEGKTPKPSPPQKDVPRLRGCAADTP